MSTNILKRLLGLSGLILALLCPVVQAAGGSIVVANRNSATLSVIDVESDTATTVNMPPGANTPQPMYVAYSATYDRVFVGDRANNRVLSIYRPLR